MHTKCRSAASLELDLCVKFAIKFSISLEIAVSHENLEGEADNFFPTVGGCVLRGWGGLGNICCTWWG